MPGCLAVFGKVPSFVRLFHSKIPSSILTKLEISRQLFNGCLRSLLTNSPTNIKNPSKSSAHEQADFFDVPTSGG
jgi:hypothetical protein